MVVHLYQALGPDAMLLTPIKVFCVAMIFLILHYKSNLALIICIEILKKYIHTFQFYSND